MPTIQKSAVAQPSDQIALVKSNASRSPKIPVLDFIEPLRGLTAFSDPPAALFPLARRAMVDMREPPPRIDAKPEKKRCSCRCLKSLRVFVVYRVIEGGATDG